MVAVLVADQMIKQILMGLHLPFCLLHKQIYTQESLLHCLSQIVWLSVTLLCVYSSHLVYSLIHLMTCVLRNTHIHCREKSNILMLLLQQLSLRREELIVLEVTDVFIQIQQRSLKFSICCSECLTSAFKFAIFKIFDTYVIF